MTRRHSLPSSTESSTAPRQRTTLDPPASQRRERALPGLRLIVRPSPNDAGRPSRRARCATTLPRRTRAFWEGDERERRRVRHDPPSQTRGVDAADAPCPKAVRLLRASWVTSSRKSVSPISCRHGGGRERPGVRRRTSLALAGRGTPGRHPGSRRGARAGGVRHCRGRAAGRAGCVPPRPRRARTMQGCRRGSGR